MQFSDARAPLAARARALLAASGLLLTALLLSGCGSDSPTGGSCVPGRVVRCTCVGGVSAEGYQACEDDGTAYGKCMCFAGGATGGSGGAGGASGAGGSGAELVTPGETCQILGATAPCDCGAQEGRSGCYSYDTGPAWSECRCPRPPPTGGTGGVAGTGGLGGTGGFAGTGGVGGTGGVAGEGGTGGFAGTGGFGGTGGIGAGGCPDKLTCAPIVLFCVDGTGTLPSCLAAGAPCMGTGTCFNNSGSGGVMLSCLVPCTP